MKIIKDIITQIEKYNKIAIFHHKNIDGDSISSSYGLLLALKNKYPKKEIVWVANIDYIKSHFGTLPFNYKFVKSKIDSSYLTIIGDSSESKRVEYYDEFAKGKYKICFDHHTSPANIDVDLLWKEPGYPASSMQAFMIAKKLGITLNENIAFFLLIGLLTDTGWFRFNLADERPVKMYGELLKFVSNRTMDSFLKGMSQNTKHTMEVKAFVLSKIQYKKNVSYINVSKKEADKYGKENIKANIHLIANIKDFPIWIHIIEANDDEEHKYGINMRSNGPNINSVAIKHNGGGHVRASGCKAFDDKELNQIFKELSKLKG